MSKSVIVGSIVGGFACLSLIAYAFYLEDESLIKGLKDEGLQHVEFKGQSNFNEGFEGTFQSFNNFFQESDLLKFEVTKIDGNKIYVKVSYPNFSVFDAAPFTPSYEKDSLQELIILKEDVLYDPINKFYFYYGRTIYSKEFEQKIRTPAAGSIGLHEQKFNGEQQGIGLYDNLKFDLALNEQAYFQNFFFWKNVKRKRGKYSFWGWRIWKKKYY